MTAAAEKPRAAMAGTATRAGYLYIHINIISFSSFFFITLVAMERMAYMFEKKQKRMWSSNTKKVCRKGKLVEAVDKS